MRFEVFSFFEHSEQFSPISSRKAHLWIFILKSGGNLPKISCCVHETKKFLRDNYERTRKCSLSHLKFQANWIDKNRYRSTVEKKEQISAAFCPFFKSATFELSKYESFAAFIMPKHSSNRNFRPFWAFIDFLQTFKAEKFAS